MDAEVMRDARNGDLDAQFTVALSYLRGLFGEQNTREGIKWLKKAAKNGYPAAQAMLGNAYFFGEDGVAKNLNEAINWYMKAANQGNLEAFVGMGRCYFHGEGVRQDYREAVNWLRKPAENGRSEAQYYLGMCYFYGWGINQNTQRAEDLLRKAAADGWDVSEELAEIEKNKNPIKSFLSDLFS